MKETSPIKTGPSTEQGSDNYSPMPFMSSSAKKAAMLVPKLDFKKVFEQQKLINEYEENLKAEEEKKKKEASLAKQMKNL